MIIFSHLITVLTQMIQVKIIAQIWKLNMLVFFDHPNQCDVKFKWTEGFYEKLLCGHISGFDGKWLVSICFNYEYLMLMPYNLLW